MSIAATGELPQEDATRPGRVQRPATLAQAVEDHVRNAILSGTYKPGQPLREVHVAAEVGTSRGTVREALRALADDGLVDVIPHRGIFVTRITPSKASDLYELRLLLEPRAVRLGVESGMLLRPAYVARMRAVLKRLELAAAAQDAPGSLEAERELHRLLCSASGNDLLTALLATLHVQQRRILALVRALGADDYGVEASEHRRLLDEVLGGDPKVAERAVATHLRGSRTWLLRRMREFDSA